MSHRPSPVKGKAWQQLSFKERFEASYTINTKTLCWEWKRAGAGGYGGIDLGGKTISAHRASWIFLNGNIKPEECVLHKCDNRLCVNPDHLYLGDKKQNRKDFMERHPRASELVEIGQRAGTEGVKRFWASMNNKEKEEFCKRRAQIQSEKRMMK